MRRRSLPALLPALGLVACESVESGDIRSGALYADISVESQGTGTAQVSTTLRLGGMTSNTFVNLEGGDVLTTWSDAEGATEPVELAETHVGNIYTYLAELPADAEGTTYTVSLERSVDESAPSSTAVMPAWFDLTAPEAATVLSRSTEDLVVGWTPGDSGDKIWIEVQGDCLVVNNFEVEGDPGSYTIAAGELESWDSTEDVACDAEVHVLRYRNGSLDPAYGEGGTIYAGQRRVVEIRLDP